MCEWVKQLEILTNFACTEPHAAFSGFIHGSDLRVFKPLARCHLHHNLPAVHKKNENEKKKKPQKTVV